AREARIDAADRLHRLDQLEVDGDDGSRADPHLPSAHAHAGQRHQCGEGEEIDADAELELQRVQEPSLRWHAPAAARGGHARARRSKHKREQRTRNDDTLPPPEAEHRSQDGVALRDVGETDRRQLRRGRRVARAPDQRKVHEVQGFAPARGISSPKVRPAAGTIQFPAVRSPSRPKEPGCHARKPFGPAGVSIRPPAPAGYPRETGGYPLHGEHMTRTARALALALCAAGAVATPALTVAGDAGGWPLTLREQ